MIKSITKKYYYCDVCGLEKDCEESFVRTTTESRYVVYSIKKILQWDSNGRQMNVCEPCHIKIKDFLDSLRVG